MELWTFLRRGEWPIVVGYLFFVTMMATGYFYNLTFVQLGLVDLGTRVVGLSEAGVALHMAVFAVVTASVALLAGVLMQRRGWSAQFVTKLRLAFGVVLIQTILTALAPAVRGVELFLAWILASSVAMGIGTPATFGLTVDLVPVRARGSAGALIAAGAFAPAAILSADWRVEVFAGQMLPLMLLGALTLAPLAWGRFGLVKRLAAQHELPAFGRGRFVVDEPGRRGWMNRRLFAAFVIMFAIYFIDSLGFLRIIATPVLVARTWQAPEVGTLLFIGAIHVLGAAIAGVLYGPLGVRSLFAWIFGIFALLHLSYAIHTQIVPESYVGLGSATLYALAVSIYTTVNFAIWADLSTPRTIALNSALGVVLSAWMATFLSTGLSLWWGAAEVPLVEHFDILAALATLLFLAVLAGSIVQAWRRLPAP